MILIILLGYINPKSVRRFCTRGATRRQNKRLNCFSPAWGFSRRIHFLFIFHIIFFFICMCSLYFMYFSIFPQSTTEPGNWRNVFDTKPGLNQHFAHQIDDSVSPLQSAPPAERSTLHATCVWSWSWSVSLCGCGVGPCAARRLHKSFGCGSDFHQRLSFLSQHRTGSANASITHIWAAHPATMVTEELY